MVGLVVIVTASLLLSVDTSGALLRSSVASTLPSDNTSVRVAMTENNTLDVIVASAGGVRAPGVQNAGAVRFHIVSGQKFEVDAGTGCAGPWHPITGEGAVATPTASPVGPTLLTLCVATTQSTNLPGTITGTFNSNGAARTFNTVALEVYVSDVVTAESPHYWGTLGGAGPQGEQWGFQELEAQAVAVRSYVLSNIGGYGGYADSCDKTCQTYRGETSWSAIGERATLGTRGQVLVMPSGAIADAQYSASSGGWTASASSPFTPVEDRGDGICITPPPPGFSLAAVCNPNHDWSRTISLATIASFWPTTGATPELRIATSNTLGTWKGRVQSVTLAGNATTQLVTAKTFVSDLALPSNYFTFQSETTSTLRIEGHGYGHGVGMGQWGALGYAIGQDTTSVKTPYLTILSHFYSPATVVTLANEGPLNGYLLVGADGGIFTFGGAQFYGSMGGQHLIAPIVGIAATPTGGGYWEVASDGGIFAFGNAQFYGSMGGQHLNKPIVGIAATPTGGGYWEVASDGGIFAFGNAQFFGSMGGQHLNAPVVEIGTTPTGGGYWEVASDGGIFAFGNAMFYGSMGATPLVKPINALRSTPDGAGYFEVASDGGIFAFGDAHFCGSLAGESVGSETIAVIVSSTNTGYLLVNQSGVVTGIGTMSSLGSMSTVVPGYNGEIVAATPIYGR